MSHLATLSHNFDSGVEFAIVTWRVAQWNLGVSLSCATQLPNTALLYSV